MLHLFVQIMLITYPLIGLMMFNTDLYEHTVSKTSEIAKSNEKRVQDKILSSLSFISLLKIQGTF